MRAELVVQIEKNADRDYDFGLCKCEKDESKLIYARRLQYRVGKTIEAILDGAK